MTRARALLIRLLDIYRKQGYRHSLLEIQKLTYFLQAAGENLKLNFDRRHYGPYAENLNHVLQKLDGHYIRGYGDRSGKSEIYLLEGAIEEAQKFLERDEDANARLEKIAEVIQGFETPYGMELLSTVLWIANETPNVKEDALEAVEKVQEWSVRKKFKMQPQHIQKAWDRLRKADWLKAA
jgi:uncharacterized protein YwgA